MILIPFIYFALFTFYLWKKHEGIDVCVYMTALYAFTSLMAIVIVAGGFLEEGGILFDEYDLQLSPVPTVLYCAFITLGILPFSMVYKKDLKKIETPNPLIVYLLGWFLIGIAFLNLYLVADSTAEILSGDLSTIRSDHYNGIESPAQIKAMSLPFVLSFLYYFNAATLLALPLFFYYICFEKRAWWYKTLLFFASFSMPLAGIQTADRTEIVFYAIMFLSCLCLFHKFLSPRVKRTMKMIAIPLSIIMTVYIVAVSSARFDERKGNGAGANVLEYAGQSYINFCFFWEKANWDNLAPERLFPLTSHYVLHIDNDDHRRGVRSGQQGFFMSVFASYVGDVMLDLSPLGMFVWCTSFFLIAVILFVRPHREELSVGDYLAFFSLSVIPIFGIFYYRYMAFPYTFMLGIVAIVYVTDKFDIKLL